MKKELLQGLSEEQIAKAKACNNKDELLSLAKEEGVELTEEQLNAISGGGACHSTIRCPVCNSRKIEREASHYRCKKCGAKFL